MAYCLSQSIIRGIARGRESLKGLFKDALSQVRRVRKKLAVLETHHPYYLDMLGNKGTMAALSHFDLTRGQQWGAAVRVPQRKVCLRGHRLQN